MKQKLEINKNRKEWLRIQKDFEKFSSEYYDLSLILYFFDIDKKPENIKFEKKAYSINLWQYYGNVLNNDKLIKKFFNQKITRFGLTGAKLNSFAFLAGDQIELFRKIAIRAGSLLSKKEVNKLNAEIIKKIPVFDTPGKPLFITNGDPLAVWLNLLLYFISVYETQKIKNNKLTVDPFIASLSCIDYLLKDELINDDRSKSAIERLKFKVALSFPGEKRDFVEQVSNELIKKLGSDTVFYDKIYTAQLARPNLNILLQSIYHDKSDLIVVFLCKEYDQKEWCGLEMRAIHDIIKQKQYNKIMFMRFDDSKIEGIFSIDGYVEIKNLTPSETTEFILTRLGSNNDISKNDILFQFPQEAKPIANAETSIEYENDKNHIITIFKEIFTIDELDNFINRGLYPYLIFETFLKFDDLYQYTNSLRYHIYDDVLNEYIGKFIEVLNKIDLHGKYFTQTNNPNLLRPQTVMDCALIPEVEAACKEVPKLCIELHSLIKVILNHVRKNYKDIIL